MQVLPLLVVEKNWNERSSLDYAYTYYHVRETD